MWPWRRRHPAHPSQPCGPGLARPWPGPPAAAQLQWKEGGRRGKGRQSRSRGKSRSKGRQKDKGRDRSKGRGKGRRKGKGRDRGKGRVKGKGKSMGIQVPSAAACPCLCSSCPVGWTGRPCREPLMCTR